MKPCLVSGCPEQFDSAPLLAAHLVAVHLWNGSTAFMQAREAFQAARATEESPMPRPPIPRKGQRQPPMSERTCGACGKKGHRRDHCPGSKAESAPARTGKKCAWHKDGKNSAKRRVAGAGPDALTRIKAAIAEHERAATALREALAILEG